MNKYNKYIEMFKNRKNPGRGKSEKTNFWNSSFNFGKHLHPQESSSQGMKMKPVVDEMFPGNLQFLPLVFLLFYKSLNYYLI